MSTATRGPVAARLRPSDLARLALVGLRTRKLRAALSALGIAIGVAAIVAVLGLSSSSAAGLNAEIAALGTNLLTVQPGNNFSGGVQELPPQAPAMIGRLPGVYAVQTTGTIDGVSVYRSPLIPTVNTNALSVDAASLGLPGTAGTSLAQGKFLNAATAREPVCVLGAAAAQLLGIDHVYPGERVWAGNMWLYVAGILKPDVLSPDVDSSVLVGYPFAERAYGFDGHPTTIYVKAIDSRVNAVDSLLGAQTDPEDPTSADVSVPSSALVAQADAKGAFNTLFLGLGAVALLVGAIGVANIMVIAVLERRSEIGLRRALGATRGHIRIQFLSEAVALALAGGAAGVVAGAAATAVYAHSQRLGRGHPGPGLGRRPGRRAAHRGPRRAAARAQSRPPGAHRSPVDPLICRTPVPGERSANGALPSVVAWHNQCCSWPMTSQAWCTHFGMTSAGGSAGTSAWRQPRRPAPGWRNWLTWRRGGSRWHCSSPVTGWPRCPASIFSPGPMCCTRWPNGCCWWTAITRRAARSRRPWCWARPTITSPSRGCWSRICTAKSASSWPSGPRTRRPASSCSTSSGGFRIAARTPCASCSPGSTCRSTSTTRTAGPAAACWTSMACGSRGCRC